MTQIKQLQIRAKKTREIHGFYCPASIDETDAMLAKLMLVVTEVAEAAEAVRHGDFENFKEEIADIQIRLLDIAASVGFDTDVEIEKKMDKNDGREYMHGKRA